MRAFATSRGLLGDPHITDYLQKPVIKADAETPQTGDVAIGWGLKANTKAIRAYADKHGLPFLCLEDGFYAYRTHPARGARRQSLIVDTCGIYYDARQPSDLEKLIEATGDLSAADIARAARLRQRIVTAKLSKYNHAPIGASAELIASLKGKECVLVVDQTAGDVSIEAGHADVSSFQDILDAAVLENPIAQILVKVHPDVLLGKKAGHYTRSLPERCILVPDLISPHTLFEFVSKVYVVTSQMGFEALLAGLPVVTFGMPFYAGWGLTDDRVEASCPAFDRRKARPELDQLVHAALIDYPLYLNCETSEICEIERVLDGLEIEKAIPRPSGGTAWMVGFSLWKKTFVDAFVRDDFHRVKYIRKSSGAKLRPESHDAVVLWGRRDPDLAARLAGYCPVWHMEDGFIRSVGLGVDLSRPASLVLDQRGVYFDATSPSDLEHFLSTFDFRDWHRDVAHGFKQQILESRISKYNVGTTQTEDMRAAAGGRKILLVCGQVEADASLRFGAGAIATNRRLIEAVRSENPDAFILYKPHPDVLAGDRQGSVPGDILERAVDRQVADIDIHSCFDIVDSVHVMTSLAGFEALMRDIPVTVWGRPFYAGWGLTDDREDFGRRGRRLAITELVYGAYMAYPTYAAWPGGQRSDAINTVSRMKKVLGNKDYAEHDSRFRMGWLRKATNLIEAFFK